MHSFFVLVGPIWLAFMSNTDGSGIIATACAVVVAFVVGFAIDCFEAYREEKRMPVPTKADFLSWKEQRKLYVKPHQRKGWHRRPH